MAARLDGTSTLIGASPRARESSSIAVRRRMAEFFQMVVR
jgi:hypothetical protein